MNKKRHISVNLEQFEDDPTPSPPKQYAGLKFLEESENTKNIQKGLRASTVHSKCPKQAPACPLY